jgi:uncharacterized protein YggE
MELHKALRLAMDRAGLRSEDVASRAKISFDTVCRLRSNRLRSNPRPIMVEALKRAVPGLTELLDDEAVA